MDFADRLKQFSRQASGLLDRLRNEEATKVALVLPFLQHLGYNVFDPGEVMPEFEADVGIKKGERVDYAILQDGKPMILIEAKPYGDDLTTHGTQLYRYFSATDAKFAILTNGIIYKFFSDLHEPNKLDTHPFFEFDLLNLSDQTISELKKFHKQNFDIEDLSLAAVDLKYTRLVKQSLDNELKDPSDDFVRFWLRDIYPGRLTQGVVEQFRPMVKRAFSQYISDLINDRLTSAMKNTSVEKESAVAKEETVAEVDAEPGIETTEEEIEAFFIIKSILRSEIDPSRLTYKDTLRYFNVLVDDVARKWICRLYLREGSKSIVFHREDYQSRRQFDSLDDLYNFRDKFVAALKAIEGDQPQTTE